MRKPKRGRPKVHEQIGVSEGTLRRKIEEVKRDDPELSNKQAVGKAVGILKGAHGKK